MSPKSRGRKKPAQRRTEHGRPGSDPRGGTPIETRMARLNGHLAPDASRPSFETLCAALVGEADQFQPLMDTPDPLAAELRAAHLLATYTVVSGISPTDFATALVTVAAQQPQSRIAAMTSAVGSLLPSGVTATVLGDLIRTGVELPAWHERISMATPGRAWRFRDAFGDQEVYVVSYSYDDAEHAIVVEVITCPVPRVLVAQITTSPERARQAVEGSADPTGLPRVLAEIPLWEAYATLTVACRHSHPSADQPDLVLLPLVRNRIGLLPHRDLDVPLEEVPEPATEDPFSRADRAAVVKDFLAATGDGAGVDAKVLRFWAEVLVGYTALTGAAPIRVGPVWLDHALLDHVPRVFELTPEQRAGLLPAVTAWAVWAAQQQELPAQAADVLRQRIAEVEQAFDQLYADPELLPLRCYLGDVSARSADGRDLLRSHRLRTLAVPPPQLRPAGCQTLLASDPTDRRRIHAARVAESGSPDGVELEEWLDVLALVSDGLWENSPPELGAAVLEQLYRLDDLYERGHPDGLDVAEVSPDLLDHLAELVLEHREDAAGFLAAVQSGSWAQVD